MTAWARSGLCSRSSSASIGPRPRTSPICSWRAARSSSRARSATPSSSARGAERGSCDRVEHDGSRGTGDGVAPERPTEAAGLGGVHDLRAARDRRQRQAAAERLARHEQIWLDAVVVLDRPHRPGPPHARLHLVGDEEDPVPRTHFRESREVVRRHDDETALALDGLEHDAGDRFGVDLALEQVLEGGDRSVGVDAAVRVRRRSPVDLARERTEARLVRPHLARHRHRQERAAVEAVVENDNGRPAGGAARDLDRVLDRLGAAS